MQEIRQKKSAKCNNDCFNCLFEDCILGNESHKTRYNREYQRIYRETHKEQAKMAQHDWYVRNAEKRKIQTKERRVKEQLAKLSTCSYCRCLTGQTVMIYHKRVYCSDKCLMEHLLLKAKQKEVRVIKKEELLND